MVELTKKIWHAKYRPFAHMLLLFVLAQALGAFLAPIFLGEDMQAFGKGNETRVENPFIYIAIVLIFTGIVLFVVKKRKKRVVKYVFLFAIAMTIVFVVTPIADAIINPRIIKKWNRNYDALANIEYLGHINIGTEHYLVEANATALVVYNMKTGAIVWSDNFSEIRDICILKDYIIVSSDNITQVFRPPWGMEILNISSYGYITGYETQVGVNVVIYNATSAHLYNITETNFNLTGMYNMGRFGSYTMGYLEADIYVVLNSTCMVTLKFEAEDLNITSIENIIADDIVIGDINGDLKQDIVAFSNHTLYGYTYTDTGLKQMFQKEAVSAIKGVAIGDLNGDGVNEVFVACRNNLYVIYYDPESHDWPPEYQFAITWYYPTTMDDLNGVIMVIDHDGDGKGEIYMDKGVRYGLQWAEVYFESPTPIQIYLPFFIGILTSGILMYALIKNPEWYVVDSVGIIVAAGAIAIFGISLHILPTIILLVILAIYDAISVYRTRHMVDLADSVIDLKLPILLIAPKKKGYSYKTQNGIKKELGTGKERGAMFMGLGDVIIPTILGVSAMTFLQPRVFVSTTLFTITTSTLVGVCSMAGAIIGYLVLMRYVVKGNPQAGLPFLNTGAILGYIIAYIIVYGDLTFGIVLP